MKHSSYFEGKVQSLSLNTENGKATAGVIEPGTYSFSTSSEETMLVTEGELKYRLPGGNWMTAKKGQKFIVEAGLSFDCKAEKDASYICYYK